MSGCLRHLWHSPSPSSCFSGKLRTVPMIALSLSAVSFPSNLKQSLIHRSDYPASFCRMAPTDRKSTRLNSSHLGISHAVFCLTKKQPAKIVRDVHKRSRQSFHSALSKHNLIVRRKRGEVIRMRSVFFNDTVTTEIYALSLHDPLPI